MEVFQRTYVRCKIDKYIILVNVFIINNIYKLLLIDNINFPFLI